MILNAISLLGFCTILCGILYPIGLAVMARMVFPFRSTGSLLYRHGVCAGSLMLAQHSNDPRFFASRPSATPGFSSRSGGSNLGPLSSALRDSIVQRTSYWIRSVPGVRSGTVPLDLLTTSGSGFDPHISLDAALFQLPRVAGARGYSEAREQELVDLIRNLAKQGATSSSGKPIVNVLELNLLLDSCNMFQVRP